VGFWQHDVLRKTDACTNSWMVGCRIQTTKIFWEEFSGPWRCQLVNRVVENIMFKLKLKFWVDDKAKTKVRVHRGHHYNDAEP
jgi:hypothetical protein